MYFNTNDTNSYDAIVIGSGISGGWAAKELCENGLKTLVLERGRDVKHVEDYPTMHKDPWDLPNRDRMTREELKDYQKQDRTGYTMRPSTKHWWVKDTEHPYTEVKRFDWIRGYHVGGRSLMWGRHSYRLSDLDFEANAKDGYGVDWPIRYRDLAPWYDHVEGWIGVQGEKLGLPQLPDGNFLPPYELNCVEQYTREKVAEHFGGRALTIGRTANLTKPIHGRAQCAYRNRCMRGCPFGAYFSSQSSTLPAAEATGNLKLRPHSIVTRILYDKDARKATGVEVLDAQTGETMEFRAKVIFCCASALGTTWILMHSKSDRFPEGMGNDSGELGHNLMDHHFRVGAVGTTDQFSDKYYKGRRPTGTYMPRFRNIDKASERRDYIRGFGYQGGGSRSGWAHQIKELSVGPELKEAIMEPGPWRMNFHGFGECLPYHENHVKLNPDVLDVHGLPTLTIDCEFKENELAMRKDMKGAAAEMLEASGFKDIRTYDDIGGPGLGIHEMGTARMGRNPRTSVLNKYNQIHAVPNVFVTDGACMTSAGCQNPSLTYMALTARAANHAVSELKKGNLS